MKILKIGEISKAYDIGIDSLRYYEKKGLIEPERLENGYRHYRYIDLWKLNIIKELRMLNFPLTNIERYLNHRTLASTRELLDQEVRTIDRQIEELSQLKERLTEKKNTIDVFTNQTIPSAISIKPLPKRDCILFTEDVSRAEEIDYFFRKLQLKSKESIPLIGHKVLCIFMPVDQIDSENIYSKVFSFYHIDNPDFDTYNFNLPEAKYLSITYKGSHDYSREHAKMLIQFARENDYEILTDPYEICHIDIHETSDRNEYITEIQMAVRKIQ